MSVNHCTAHSSALLLITHPFFHPFCPIMQSTMVNITAWLSSAPCGFELKCWSHWEASDAEIFNSLIRSFAQCDSCHVHCCVRSLQQHRGTVSVQWRRRPRQKLQHISKYCNLTIWRVSFCGIYTIIFQPILSASLNWWVTGLCQQILVILYCFAS